MSYEIGFASKGKQRVSVTHLESAIAALNCINALQASDEEIRYIKVPEGYEIGIGELQMLAERER